ncbi:glycosyltransferase [Candidatus Saccharibacteria bacterium]|nr:glycosyltransferase [Candidatus Saccharibacteria bacterium]
MKIAIFTDCYLDLTGGIVSSINADKEELERRGHTVYVFSSGYRRNESELKKLAKNHVYPVKSCRIIGHGITPIARRPKIIERELSRTHPEIKDFDIYYIHYEAGCSIAGLHLAKKYHIKSIQVMHGREDVGEDRLIPYGFRTIVAILLNWFHSWYIPHRIKVHRDDYLADTTAKAKMWTLMVNHANYADLVVSPSEHFRKKLQHYGVTKPFEVLPHGLADALCEQNIPPRTLKSNETLRMIWHSRLSGEKRILEFLQAIKILSETKTNFHLDVYGDGPDLAKAKKYVYNYKLPVTFHGATPHDKVWQALTKAHLDILASYNFDNYSMTLVESVVSGAPAFIADPDMQEILPKDSYILSKDPSSESMAAALSDLLEHPECVAKMSHIAIKNRSPKKISTKISKFESLTH